MSKPSTDDTIFITPGGDRVKIARAKDTRVEYYEFIDVKDGRKRGRLYTKDEIYNIASRYDVEK